MAASCMASAISAQEDGGTLGLFTFSQGITLSDSEDTVARTDLSVALSSATRRQRLAFSFDGALEQEFGGDTSTEVIDPTARLTYGIESRQTALDTSFSYTQSDADDFVENIDESPGVLVLDEGTREDFRFSFDYETGREDRFGATIRVDAQEIEYSDTTSEDLVDTTEIDVDLGLRFDFDDRISARLGYVLSDTDRNNDRDVEDQELTAGVDLAVSPTIEADVTLGVSQVTVTEDGEETEEEGVTLGVNVIQARPNGEMRFQLSSDITESGRRTTATLGRQVETPRGALAFDPGISWSDDDDLRPFFTLAYTRETRRGAYGLSVDQSFDNDSDGDEVLNSRLQFDWQRALTARSRVSSDVTYQFTYPLDEGDDTSRLDIGFGYSQDLTADWALTTRYTYSYLDEEDGDTERENELFVGLETSFGWRP